MEKIDLLNPVNPNFVLSFLVPSEFIQGKQLEGFIPLVDELFEMIEEYLTVKKAAEVHFTMLNILKKNELDFRPIELIILLYRLVLQVGAPDLLIEKVDAELENRVRQLLLDAGIKKAEDLRWFQGPDEANRFEIILQVVRKSLNPVYDFIAQYSFYLGDENVLTKYKWKEEKVRNLEARQSPIIYETGMDQATFRRKNYVLGKAAMDLLFSDKIMDDSTPNKLWRLYDKEIFRMIMSEIMLAGVTAAWNTLEAKTDDFRYFLSSGEVATAFAEYVALIRRNSSGGNAYAGRLYSNRGMTFNLSSGIKTKQWNNLKITSLRKRLKTAVFDSKKGKLFLVSPRPRRSSGFF